MSVVYGLYSTGEGAVRYTGQTEYTARKSLDLIITKALDREPGALYDWIRDEWRSGHDIHAHILQDDVIPSDLEMFERYWSEQFPNLLNAEPPAHPSRLPSEVGQRVNAALLALLRGEKMEGEG